MSRDNKPLIAVVGALSKQGRSVANSLLQSQRYRVRALTRNKQSPAARELQKSGAEIVEVNVETDEATALITAFNGATGAFLMTPGVVPAMTRTETVEMALGKKLADAALKAGVEHIVFSSLENVEKITAGKLWAPHFTDKGKIEEYIRTLPVKSSFIQMAFFYTNLLEYYPPHQEGDTLVFPIYLPEDYRAPFVDPLTATGPAVLEILDNRDAYAGRTLPVVGEMLTPQEMVETFSRVSGKKAIYRSAYTREALLQHFPSFAENDALVDELTGMTEYVAKYGYFSKSRDLRWSRKINPTTLTWEAFLIDLKWQGETYLFSRHS